MLISLESRDWLESVDMEFNFISIPYFLKKSALITASLQINTAHKKSARVGNGFMSLPKARH